MPSEGTSAMPTETPQQTTSSTEVAAPAPPPPMDMPPGFDLDAKELEAARLEAERETKGDTTPAPTTPQPQSDQPAPNAADKPRPQAVPYDRFAEAVKSRRRAEEENAYLRGKLEALEAMRAAAPSDKATTPAAAPPASPADDIAAIRAEIRKQAARADRGEITFEELEQFREEAEGKIDAIREQRLAAKVQTQGLADTVFEQSHLDTLMARHPYVANLLPQHVSALERIAYTEASAEGRPYGTGPAETIRLREHIARLSDTYGPRWNVVPSKASATPAPAKPSSPSAAAQARLSKMDMAERMPPDVALTGTGSAANDLTESQLLAMTDEEVAALPAATRERILNRR